jgi:hypothetical protein
MVRKVKETLGETKARLRYELEQRTLDRIASLHIEAKATAKKKLSRTRGKTTDSNLHSTTTTTTTRRTTHTTTTTRTRTTHTTTTITTTTTNEPTFQTTSSK